MTNLLENQKLKTRDMHPLVFNQQLYSDNKFTSKLKIKNKTYASINP